MKRQNYCSKGYSWSSGHRINTRPSEKSACVVMHEVATRRSKQTGQHKQHLINTNPATNIAVVHWHSPTNRVGQRVKNRHWLTYLLFVGQHESHGCRWLKLYSVIERVLNTEEAGFCELSVLFLYSPALLCFSFSSPVSLYRAGLAHALQLIFQPLLCMHDGCVAPGRKYGNRLDVFGRLKLCLILCF